MDNLEINNRENPTEPREDDLLTMDEIMAIEQQKITDMVPQDSPDVPEGLALERHGWDETLQDGSKMRLVINPDGSVTREEKKPDVTIHHENNEAVNVTEPPIINKESDEEYLKRLQELLKAYTDYQKLLATFGKTDIKEVLADTKNLALLNKVPEDNQENNIDRRP